MTQYGTHDFAWNSDEFNTFHSVSFPNIPGKWEETETDKIMVKLKMNSIKKKQKKCVLNVFRNDFPLWNFTYWNAIKQQQTDIEMTPRWKLYYKICWDNFYVFAFPQLLSQAQTIFISKCNILVSWSKKSKHRHVIAKTGLFCCKTTKMMEFLISAAWSV